ncbi:hypothetical protein MKW92_023245 [Papaver armeniacum]|nr:hypothetical protein MKW92_023245 [Papaver armeniacum]
MPDPRKADHVTLDPLNEGFGAIIKSCKGLRHLALSGLLEIRDSQFGDTALLTNMGKYEAMRYLWMPSSDITLGGCKSLAKNMPNLNMEIMNENQKKLDDIQKVSELYVYRSLVGTTGGAYAWEGYAVALKRFSSMFWTL